MKSIGEAGLVMNRGTQESAPKNADASAAGVAPTGVPSGSRRRLIKFGVSTVPVVVTLASRPALAWHCKSPSAWGSEIINPNTSLRTNAGHQSYPDETWYISNWADDTARSGTAYSGKPWDKFFLKYSDIKATVSSDSSLVTIAMLQSKGFACGTADPNAKVRTLLAGSGTALQKSTIVAQLNYKCLSPYASNQMELCLSFGELTKMASGSYIPLGGGPAWNAATIVQYLSTNYMAL